MQFIATALSAADVATVTLEVSGDGINPAITSTLTRTNDTWQGTIGSIPAGPARLFRASSFDAGGVLRYRGEATAAITANTTTVIAVTMQQVNAPPPFSNAAPVIDAIVMSGASVDLGDTVTVAVTAHDPNGDPLTYAWSASRGAFDSTATAATAWTAPSTGGSDSLTIQVSDPAGLRAAASMTIVVVDNAQGSANVAATVNTWPNISNVLANPGRIDVGQATALSAAATDNDGDFMRFGWTSTCAGSFSDAAATAPSFTLSALPAGGNCTFTVLVEDGRGGQNTGSVTIGAGTPMTPVVAPQVDSIAQSQATVGGTETLTFNITAHDLQGLGLTFTWSANNGAITSQSDSAGTSQISWTSTACPATPVSSFLTVVVANSAGASASRSFVVTSTCTPGCLTAADCNGTESCNTTTHVCESACGDSNHTDCNTGCCSAGTCVDGAANANACGLAGACVSCGGAGPLCTGGVCATSWAQAGATGQPVDNGIIIPNLGATPQAVYALTTTGVQMTTNGGALWSGANTGLPATFPGEAIGVNLAAPNNLIVSGATGTGNHVFVATAPTPMAWTTGLIPSRDFKISSIRFQQQVGHMAAGWDPGDGATVPPGPVVLTHQGPNSTAWIAHPVGTLTGTARVLAGTSPTLLYVAVNGTKPDSSAGTGGVYKSIDKGITWTPLQNGIDATSLNQVWTMAVDPATPNTLWVGIAGPGRIYKSTDGGANWAQPTTLPGAAATRVYAMAIHPSNGTIYVGTSSGVYRSSDGGTTWTFAGLPGVAVRSLAVETVAPTTMYAGIGRAPGVVVTRTGGDQ